MFWKWKDGQSFNYRCTGRWNSGMEKSATASVAATYSPTPIMQLSSHPCTSPLSSCASSGVRGSYGSTGWHPPVLAALAATRTLRNV